MAILFVALLLIEVAASLYVKAPKFTTPTYDPNCPAKWKNLSPEHTMCIVGDVGKDLTFDPQLAVDHHNKRRAGVDPPATNMRKVYWDEEAAEVARKWARQCFKYGWHEEAYDSRSLPSYKYIKIGQNSAGTPVWIKDIVFGIDIWYNEVKSFTYGVGTLDPSNEIGHFAQVVSHEVYRIGCGMALCPSPFVFDNVVAYVCNYITGDVEGATPYEKGETCAKCKGHCKGGLCDCGPMVCKHKSIPRDKVCSCECQPNMSGADCSKVSSCEEDEVECAAVIPEIADRVCPYALSDAKRFYRYVCPKKCGLCK